MSKLDAEIDRAVREMLDVEPPAGLRGRVIDRLEHPRSSGWSWAWIAAPIAAAAIVVLAVMTPWRSGTATRPPRTGSGIDVRLAVESSPHPPANPAPGPATGAPRPAGRTQVAYVGPRAPRPGMVVAANAVAEDTNFTIVEALAGPASIAVERLTGPPEPTLRSIEPPPLQIRALEVNPLPETPRERREE